MQFQCGSCGFYKNKTALQVHLHTKHKIYISLTRAVHQIRDSAGNPIRRGSRILQYNKRLRDGIFTFSPNSLYIYSNRRYVCYNCGGIQFRNIQQTLRHLDTVHNIHISYIKGVSKKIVYLDGI